MGTLSTDTLILYLPDIACYHWCLKAGYWFVFHDVPPALNFPALLGNWRPCSRLQILDPSIEYPAPHCGVPYIYGWAFGYFGSAHCS
jgi:hypothetical protein